ncbi:MAG TPA: dienelactone hydrolase family protein [Alphaproteobacteria bacterium]|nr:dienelactone hydrolase family protein [Alphaproteobacteria bacterium]
MGEMITLTAEDGFTLDAYKAAPEGPPKGGIVVVQEIFGVNSHIRGDTDKFARAGYFAIAPAVFDRLEKGVELGYDEAGVAQGRELMGRMDFDKALMDVRAAADAVAGAGKTGLVGYCWGGSVAWLAATRLGLPSVGYYGGGIPGFADEAPKAPVMLHFGELDAGIPLDGVEKVKAKHPDVPVHIYEGAGHGFNCDQRGSYHEPSAKLALERTLEFFGAHVG